MYILTDILFSCKNTSFKVLCNRDFYIFSRKNENISRQVLYKKLLIMKK